MGGDCPVISAYFICEEHRGAYFVGNLSKEQYALLTDYDTNTAYSRAFHTLFANIRFNWEQDVNKAHVHTLLLTPPSGNADQPPVAPNLALDSPQSGTEP